jgi:hypothetical protein
MAAVANDTGIEGLAVLIGDLAGSIVGLRMVMS